MTINLNFSNSLEKLASVLAYDISINNKYKNNILDSPTILIPNMNFAKWLKIALAKELSICMNINFKYLENGLFTIIKLFDDKQYHYKFLDTNTMELILFFILKNNINSKSEFMPIYNYLLGANEFKGYDFEIKIWQLCKKLVSLFKKYENDRPDMIQLWRNKSKRIYEDEIEECQRKLYIEMYKVKSKLLIKTGIKLFSLYDYYYYFLNRKISIESQNKDNKIYLFGFSRFSILHLELMNYLKFKLDISIFSISPSEEYWGDVKIPWVKKNSIFKMNNPQSNEIKITKDYDLFNDIDNELLALWGKLGQDNISLLYQLSEYNFNMNFTQKKEKIKKTILKDVKYKILKLINRPTNNYVGLKQDSSLQIMASPNIKREVETVYNSIINNLENDNQLFLTDIAVLVTDIDRYKPIINSVFCQSPNKIKYNLTGDIVNEESFFLKALIAIIDISLGEFSRKNILDLIYNPCVMEYWDYNFEEISIWIKWITKLGIFQDFESKKSKIDKTFKNIPKAGLHTWRQGLERLRLSKIMCYPNNFKIGKVRPNFMGLVPLVDLDSENKESVEKLCNIIEVLNDLILTLEVEKAKLSTWLYLISNIIQHFLKVPKGFDLEDKILKSFNKYLDTLLFYDNFCDNVNTSKLELNTVKLILGSYFSSIYKNYGKHLTNGVTISPLVSIRSLPFKVVYVLGLEEGSFPRRTYESSLDLTRKERRLGDITTAAKDKYAFLETLISTKKKLYLGYLYKNTKNQDLQPCSIINQLIRYLESHILVKNYKFNIIKIPNKGSNNVYYTPNKYYWSDILINYSHYDLISYINNNNFSNNIFDYFPNVLGENNPVPYFVKREKIIGKTEYYNENIKIDVSDLKSFLIDPVTTKIKFHIGVFENNIKSILDTERDNEPFNSEYPIYFDLKRISIENWILASLFDKKYCLNSDSAGQEFNMVYDHYMLKSQTPGNSFATHDKRLIMEQIIAFAEKLLPILNLMKYSKEVFSDVVVGEPKQNKIIDSELGKILKYDSSVLKIKDSKNKQANYVLITLHGSTKWVWRDNEKKWNILLPIWSKKQSQYSERYIINTFLLFLASISGRKCKLLFEPLYVKFHVVYENKIEELNYLFNNAHSSKYLSLLVEDLLNPSDLVWLPWDDITSDVNLRKFITKKVVGINDKKIFFEDVQMLFYQKIYNKFPLSKSYLPSNILDIARKKFSIFLKPVNNDLK